MESRPNQLRDELLAILGASRELPSDADQHLIARRQDAQPRFALKNCQTL